MDTDTNDPVSLRNLVYEAIRGTGVVSNDSMDSVMQALNPFIVNATGVLQQRTMLYALGYAQHARDVERDRIKAAEGFEYVLCYAGVPDSWKVRPEDMPSAATLLAGEVVLPPLPDKSGLAHLRGKYKDRLPSSSSFLAARKSEYSTDDMEEYARAAVELYVASLTPVTSTERDNG